MAPRRLLNQPRLEMTFWGGYAGRVLKRPDFFPTPGFVLRLILGEKASLVLDGQRATPGRLLVAGFEFQYRSLEEALRNLERN